MANVRVGEHMQRDVVCRVQMLTITHSTVLIKPFGQTSKAH